jgi:hypothetical protein
MKQVYYTNGTLDDTEGAGITVLFAEVRAAQAKAVKKGK